MATFGEMQSNIAGYLARSDLSTLIQEAIRRAIRYYERTPFWFNEVEDSFVTTASTKTYTLSNSYAQLTQLVINHNSYRYPLNREDFEAVNSIDSEAFTGLPELYAERNGTVRLYPIPNATFTASYVYMAKAATLTNSDSTNTFTLNAEDLIEARACWWLNLFKLRNAESAMSWKAIEAEALAALQQENTLKLSSGSIKATSF